MSLSQKFKREYRCWNIIKNACQRKTSEKYKFYGEKGVTFCTQWNSFETFFLEMGKIPENSNSLVLKEGFTEFSKLTAEWGYTKRGRKTSEGRKKNVSKKHVIKNPMNFCLTVDIDQYNFIKRLAISKSQVAGEVVTANELIRGALNKVFPYSAQNDMFEGQK